MVGSSKSRHFSVFVAAANSLRMNHLEASSIKPSGSISPYYVEPPNSCHRAKSWKAGWIIWLRQTLRVHRTCSCSYRLQCACFGGNYMAVYRVHSAWCFLRLARAPPSFGSMPALAETHAGDLECFADCKVAIVQPGMASYLSCSGH